MLKRKVCWPRRSYKQNKSCASHEEDEVESLSYKSSGSDASEVLTDTDRPITSDIDSDTMPTENYHRIIDNVSELSDILLIASILIVIIKSGICMAGIENIIKLLQVIYGQY